MNLVSAEISVTDKIICCKTCKWYGESGCNHPIIKPIQCFNFGTPANYLNWPKLYKGNRYSIWAPRIEFLSDELFEI